MVALPHRPENASIESKFLHCINCILYNRRVYTVVQDVYTYIYKYKIAALIPDKPVTITVMYFSRINPKFNKINDAIISACN